MKGFKRHPITGNMCLHNGGQLLPIHPDLSIQALHRYITSGKPLTYIISTEHLHEQTRYEDKHDSITQHLTDGLNTL